MAPTNQNQNELRDELRDIGKALQTNGNDIARRLDDIDKRQREQSQVFQTSMDNLRKELVALFVARSEFEPKHTALQTRVDKVERRMEDGEPLVQEFTTFKAKVAQLVQDMDEVNKHQASLGAKVVTGIAIVISVVSFALNLLQHVQIK